FITENSEYLVSGTRFSVPIPQKDVPISTYKENFTGLINYVSVDKEHGTMDLSFQISMPGFNYDLARNGKAKSHGWSFLPPTTPKWLTPFWKLMLLKKTRI